MRGLFGHHRGHGHGFSCHFSPMWHHRIRRGPDSFGPPSSDFEEDIRRIVEEYLFQGRHHHRRPGRRGCCGPKGKRNDIGTGGGSCDEGPNGSWVYDRCTPQTERDESFGWHYKPDNSDQEKRRCNGTRRGRRCCRLSEEVSEVVEIEDVDQEPPQTAASIDKSNLE